ncbi:MAG TPA: hypothetical protein VM778_14200 [Gemmatimonadota bacterium]|nr:hypothetical protein [Gemmatimonadota bacterium]
MDVILAVFRALYGALIQEWSNLVGTFYGVLLGGLATLGIVRWQVGEGRRSREEHDREFLTVLVEHVNREISNNLRVLRDLIVALERTDHARLDVWDWAVTIVGSFSSQAHDDLYRTGLQRYLPSALEEEIRTAHSIVFEVRNRVRQARAEHIFNSNYGDTSAELNDGLFMEVRQMLPGADHVLGEADRLVSPATLPWTGAGANEPTRRRGRIARLLGRVRR